MLSSMTGYGKQTVEHDSYQIQVEMRSVNNRFLDITFKMPRGFLHLEDKLKKIIKNYVSRGKVDVHITLSGQGNVKKSLHIDWNLFEQYIDQIAEIKEKHHIKGEITIDRILTLEEIFTVKEEEKQDEELKDFLLQAVETSCEKLNEMRQAEGAFLETDIHDRLDTLDEIVKKLQSVRTNVIESYRDRIKKRMDEHLASYGQLDDSRIVQEVAILAEKGDITEELTRLNSHIAQMRKAMEEEGSIGRKLDFICQEMHREANTIGSKSTAAEINQLDVLLKTEIEKIKEQIQNIE